MGQSDLSQELGQGLFARTRGPKKCKSGKHMKFARSPDLNILGQVGLSRSVPAKRRGIDGALPARTIGSHCRLAAKSARADFENA
jgi:hypothetical protein